MKLHNTWVRRCDKAVYMTEPKLKDQFDDPTMPFVYLNLKDMATERFVKTIMYIHKYLMNEFDWLDFLKILSLKQKLASK